MHADHQATGGGANTVSITVKFPVEANTASVTADSTSIYGVAVFDSNQGALEGIGGATETQWSFGTTPRVVTVATGSVNTLSESIANHQRRPARLEPRPLQCRLVAA
jgi:hypothetical protein